MSEMIAWLKGAPFGAKTLIAAQSFWILWKVSASVSGFYRYRVVQLGWSTALYQYWIGGIFGWIRNAVPSVKAKVQESLDKTLKDLEHSVKKPPKSGIAPAVLTKLPLKGFSPDIVKKNLVLYKGLANVDYERGLISGTVYHGGSELSDVVNTATSMFSHSNPLHPDVFPGIRQMEAEIISMVVNLFHGTPGKTCGTITSGGTESIILACKAYRDRFYHKHGYSADIFPEILACDTVHCAFDKAAHLLGMKMVSIPADPTSRKLDISRVKALISSGRTAVVVGSSPCFSHGIIDDIAELADLASSYDVGMHVDACLGSFLIPFAEKQGFPIPIVDFRIPGVTSISCDTHKYGFAPKGSSVIMYSTPELRHFQYYVNTEWSGGIYATPTVAGSRPGSLVAGCWAAMMSLGEEGYSDATRKILKAREKIETWVRSSKELFVFGEPQLSVIAIGARTLSIYDVNDAMSSKFGWNLNALQKPPSIHIAITLLSVPEADYFTSCLGKVVDELLAEAARAGITDSKKKEAGSAAIYGMAGSIPDKSLVSDLAKGYLDILYKP